MTLIQRQVSILFTILILAISFTLKVEASETVAIIGVAFGDGDVALDKREFGSPSAFYKTLGYHPDSVWAKLKLPKQNQDDALLVAKNPLLWSSQVQTLNHSLPKFSHFPFPAFQLRNSRFRNFYSPQIRCGPEFGF